MNVEYPTSTCDSQHGSLQSNNKTGYVLKNKTKQNKMKINQCRVYPKKKKKCGQPSPQPAHMPGCTGQPSASISLTSADQSHAVTAVSAADFRLVKLYE